MLQKNKEQKSNNVFVESSAVAAYIVSRELEGLYKEHMHYFLKDYSEPNTILIR